MKDLWDELSRRARQANRLEDPMPFGFEAAVMRRLAQSGRESALEAWFPMLRPAVGLAFATAILCVLLQARSRETPAPSMLVETDTLIQLAVLK